TIFRKRWWSRSIFCPKAVSRNNEGKWDRRAVAHCRARFLSTAPLYQQTASQRPGVVYNRAFSITFPEGWAPPLLSPGGRCRPYGTSVYFFAWPRAKMLATKLSTSVEHTSQ